MNLKEQGFRYMVGKGPSQYGWYHPNDIAMDPERFAAYTDCTDMTDAEFDAFMGVSL